MHLCYYGVGMKSVTKYCAIGVLASGEWEMGCEYGDHE